MTRKDYELIAGAIKAAEQRSDNGEALKNLMLRLKANNPRFDMQRFLKACGYGG